MTDFRFHVVSLIAVFMALAVGIVLGSGPLRTALVTQLNDDVADLQEQVDAAQAQVDAERDGASAGEQFVSEAADRVIGGTLQQVGVAVVVAPGTDAADVDALRERIVQAGGSVTATLELTDEWFAADTAAFRAALASQLGDTVVGVDAATSTPDRVLAHALAQALIPVALAGDGIAPDGSAPDSDAVAPAPSGATPVEDRDRAEVLLELLRQAEIVTGSVTGQVDAVVILAGGPSGGNATGGDDSDAALVSAELARFAAVAREYSGAVVAAATADGEADLPAAVRSSGEAAGRVSTVAAATSFFGTFTTVLALAEQLEGSQGHYGPGDGRALVPSLNGEN